MSLYMNRLRPRLKALLSSLGLLSDVQRFRSLIQLLAQPDFRRQRVEGWRRERAHRQRFLQFKRQYAGVLGHRLNRAGHGQKSALVASIGVPEVEAELGLVKGLELAGFTPTVLVPHQDRLVPLYYGLASIKEVRFLSDIAAPLDYAAAEAAIEPCRSMQDLVAIKYAGARVGRLAAMTALRRQRLASLDLGSTQDRRMIVNYVASSMAAAAAAQEVLQQTRPDLALVVDGVYTPEGELFETCLNNGIDVVLWNSAHKSNTLMLNLLHPYHPGRGVYSATLSGRIHAVSNCSGSSMTATPAVIGTAQLVRNLANASWVARKFEGCLASILRRRLPSCFRTFFGMRP
jgi:hypothetical protein